MIDIQVLAVEAGLFVSRKALGAEHGQYWCAGDEANLRAFANAVLEAAAQECERVAAKNERWEDGGRGSISAEQCVLAVRAMKDAL